jgi:hypothetical protein
VRAICDEINKQLNYRKPVANLIPYFLDDDFDGDWRVKIVDPDGRVICEYLKPEKLDWHTLMLLLSARREFGQSEFQRGKVEAVNKLCEHFKDLVK